MLRIWYALLCLIAVFFFMNLAIAHGQTTNICVTVPTAQVTRILDAVAVVYGYRDTVDGQPNAESKADFARRMLKVKWLKPAVLRAEAGQAEAAARATIAAGVDMDLPVDPTPTIVPTNTPIIPTDTPTNTPTSTETPTATPTNTP